jgi:hypothetical protein
VSRRTPGPERDEIIRDRKKVRNEKLRKLYSSPDNITTLESRKMGLAGNVVGMREESIQGLGWKIRRKEVIRKSCS